MNREEEKRVPPWDQRYRMDLVLRYFVEGMTIPAIVQHLKDQHGIEVGRDVPYQDISRATSRRWLKYEAPREKKLSDELKERFELVDAYVPSRGERMTVTETGARLCSEAIWNIARAKAEKKALGTLEEDLITAKKKAAEKGEELPKPGPWGFPVRIPANGEEEKGPARDFATLSKKERDRKDLEAQAMRIEIRIGVSGGYTMSGIVRALRHAIADGIEECEKELKQLVLEILEDKTPELMASLNPIVKRRFKVGIRLVLVNLVSGFDPEPDTNPIAFLSALLNDEVLRRRTKLKIFNGMPFVEIGKGKDTLKDIKVLRDVREFYDDYGFDIILTSGSSISDPDSTFPRYYQKKELTDLLVSEKVQGDYCWLPLTKTKPFSLRKLKESLSCELGDLLKYRPMTLLTLQDLAEHVKKRRDAFFILAPCAQCFLEKSQIGKAVLGQEESIVTHMVVDRESAEGILEGGD